jgi:GWxTD domain-containing protein
MTVPRLFDAATIYRGMGYVVGTPPLTFVASVRFLADSVPDSTLAIVAMSLPNHALSFHRSGDEFVAEYHVEVSFRNDSTTVRQVTRDESVRVRSFQETLRADESIIFQQFVLVPSGIFTLRVSVRDRNGPAYAQQERLDTVPRLVGSSLGAPVAVYQGVGRTRLARIPELVVNPRATLPYGEDSLRFYVEAYGVPRGSRLAARVVDADSLELWRDTVPLVGDSSLAAATLTIGLTRLPVGRADLVVGALGTPLSARAPLLVSLSDQWATTNFREMLSLLRYFERQDLLEKLRTSPPQDRAKVWREFYKATDPVPLTPENEALDEYFRRLGAANAQFEEPGTAGWLTDRGEVFITLGDPTEVYDLGAAVTATQARTIRWEYTTLRLTLYFQDLTGFGQYRLTPPSRAEYQRVLEQVRQR